MIPRPTRSTRTDTLFPDATLVRSPPALLVGFANGEPGCPLAAYPVRWTIQATIYRFFWNTCITIWNNAAIVQSRGPGCNRKQLPSDDPANGLPLHSRSAATDGTMIDRERPSPSLVPQPVSAARRALRGIFRSDETRSELHSLMRIS